MKVIEPSAVKHILARLAERQRIPANPHDAETCARDQRDVAERFPAVSADLLVRCVEVAFAASTKTEERRPARFALSLVARELIGHRRTSTQILRDPIRLDPEALRKLAPAAQVWSACLLVDDATIGQPEIWGLWTLPAEVDPNDRAIPTELVVRATAPATVHVSLWGVRIWSLEPGVPVPTSALDRSVAELVLAVQADASDSRVPALWAIVREMERHGHGGTLALCAADDEADWSGGHCVSTCGPTIERIAHRAGPRRAFEHASAPVPCSRVPFAAGCPNIDALGEHGRFRSMARAIASLADVDGAVVLDRQDLSVRAFGARLSAQASCHEVLVGGSRAKTPELVPVSRVGGMRHQAAAQWVAGRCGSRVAIVVSADGIVSLFSGRRDGGVAAFRPLTLGVDRDPG